MKNYEATRKCTDCGLEVKALLTKREAAFELFNSTELFGPSCARCGGISFTGSFTMPILDKELITEWSENEELYVEQQD